MNTIHSLLVSTHIAIGSIALVLFWVPAIARKGSPLHVKAGRIYTIAMYVVAITAFISSIIVLMDPVGIRRPDAVLDAEQVAELATGFRMFSLFLLMLSVLVFASLRHGIAALRERRQPGTLQRPVHKATLAALAILALVVGVIGVASGEVLLMIFAGIGLAAAFGMFRDVRKVKPKARELIVAHFNGLIGSGIGAYTAFFAFGGSRLFAEVLTGQLRVVPWILPAVIGTIVIRRLGRSYGGVKSRQA